MLALGRAGEAVADCDESIRLSPGFVKAYLRKGLALQEMGKVLEALEVVKLRLTRSAYQQAVGLANVFFGESAKAAGWVDEVVPAEKVLERAEEAAHEFAKLHRGAHAASKLRARAEALEAIRAGIENMPAEFGVPS